MSAVRVDPATSTMISLIGSLADNKSALGRRYGEWAVSAPTIESAVAAAAMAQDELGHARSTYPVLAKLGVQRTDEGVDAGDPLPCLAHELPDWASVIAANAVVDGVLTTFVATARDSAIEPLAQRARKILQEEGSHRVHAEAWLRRICRAGGADAELLRRRVAEMWVQAARWPGPGDHPGYAAAVAQGMVSDGPDALRERVRSWLSALLGAEGCGVALEEPQAGERELAGLALSLDGLLHHVDRHTAEHDTAEDNCGRFEACANKAAKQQADERHHRFKECECQCWPKGPHIVQPQHHGNRKRVKTQRNDEGGYLEDQGSYSAGTSQKLAAVRAAKTCTSGVHPTESIPDGIENGRCGATADLVIQNSSGGQIMNFGAGAASPS